MGRTPQPRSGGLNAQHSAHGATIVTGTTTTRGYAESSTERSNQAPNRRTPSLTLCVTSPLQSTSRLTPWTTTSTARSHGAGPRGNPNHYHSRLQMCTTKEDYDHFGYPLRSAHGQTPVYAMADTGCQSCLAGSNIVKKLGLSPKDLVPATLKMSAANGNNIAILGAAIIRLSGNGKCSGQTDRLCHQCDQQAIHKQRSVHRPWNHTRLLSPPIH